MSSIQQQITSDINLVKKKLRVVGKMPARYLLSLGVLGVVTVGMLVGLVASRQSTDDRSQAAGGGPKFYLTKPADPMNITSVVLPRETDPPTFTPVTDIQVMATAGRPVTSFSFVARLTNGAGERLSVEQADRTWEQFEFTFNSKIDAENRFEEKLYPGDSATDYTGAKLFMGTIGQQVATVQNTVWDPVRLGSFTFTPVANQPDVQLHLIPVAGRPEANSLYLKGSLINSADGEEQIAPENLIGPFTIRNPFYVDPNAPAATATPTPGQLGDISAVPIMQLVNNQWQSLPTTFDFTDFAGTELLPKYLRTEISQANVFSPWWRESTSVGFRMRVKDGATGNYRAVIPLEGQINPNTTELVQWMPDGSYSGGSGKLFAKWKVVSQGDNVYIEIPTTLTNGVANLANPGQRLLFEPGDTLEVRANVHMQNYPNPGVSRTCKVDGTIVEAPIGNPTSQVQVGTCRNNSAFRVVWASADATATPTPTTDPTNTDGLIGTRAFKDLNNNGIFEPDSGELGLGGLILSVMKQGDTSPSIVMTNPSGYYQHIAPVGAQYRVSYCATAGTNNATLLSGLRRSDASFSPSSIPPALIGKDLNTVTTPLPDCNGATTPLFTVTGDNLYYDFGFTPVVAEPTPTPNAQIFSQVNFVVDRKLYSANTATGANQLDVVYFSGASARTSQPYFKLALTDTLGSAHPENAGWQPKILLWKNMVAPPADARIISSSVTPWLAHSEFVTSGDTYNMFGVNYEKTVGGYKYLCRYDGSAWYAPTGSTNWERSVNPSGQAVSCENLIVEIRKDGAPW